MMGSAWGLRVRPRAGSGIEGMLSEKCRKNAHIDGLGQVGKGLPFVSLLEDSCDLGFC